MVLNRSESGMGAVPPGLRWEAALGCALRRLAVIFTKGVEAPTLAQHWVGSQELGARRLEPRSPGVPEPGSPSAGPGREPQGRGSGRAGAGAHCVSVPPVTCRLVWPGLRAPGTLGAQVQGPRGATALEGLEVGLTAPAPPCTAPPPARSAPRDTVARGRRRAAVPAAAPGQRRRPVLAGVCPLPSRRPPLCGAFVPAVDAARAAPGPTPHCRATPVALRGGRWRLFPQLGPRAAQPASR